ncbi:uridylate-specific endoribonuclease isoform X1 [Pleurodeles waltl]|uniref:uridylate-specific endoribonuclease isoform X1 n=1 Tax=Pleurodeles waltl TaxID=8319 RepID=UPI0037099A49
MKTCLLLAVLLGCSWAFDSCSTETCKDSCKNRCGKKLDKSFNCQCNNQCERFGDCCGDYNKCLYIEPSSGGGHDHYSKPSDVADKNSCKGRCDEAYNKKDPCHCNRKCSKFNNCCDDYSNLCKRTDSTSTHGHGADIEPSSGGGHDHYSKLSDVADKNSCKGRCDEAYNKKDPCHCNRKCSKFNNCCDDYSNLCKRTDSTSTHGHGADIEPSSGGGHDHYSKLSDVADKNSCKGRCDEAYNKKDPCHCNRKCSKFNNCCDDYSNLCKRTDSTSTHGHGAAATDGSVKGDISQKEIEAVSESLYKADVNRAQEGDVFLNKQHFASKSEGKEDQSDQPLYSYVKEEIFSKPTYAAFIRLLDNYDRQTGKAEDVDKGEIKEQDIFLQEIMKTDVMQKLYTFLHKKELYASQEEFVTDLKNMWFGLYSRGKGEMDSSGFEHVFVGEVKKGIVSGFHNWIRFYLLEKQGLVDYYCHVYDGPWETMPDVIGQQFQWDGYIKEVGSSFIGSSPEFDFSIYSLCFIARPGKACKVSLGGYPLKIQTYTWTKSSYGGGKNYIATAYPVT